MANAQTSKGEATLFCEGGISVYEDRATSPMAMVSYQSKIYKPIKENMEGKKMKILALVLVIMLFITPAFADLSDNISKAIDKYPIKGGIVYNFDTENWDAIYGIALKEFGFVDIALYHDGDEYLALGLDISVPFTAKSTIGIMTGLGVNRINRFEGETQGIMGVIGKVRF